MKKARGAPQCMTNVASYIKGGKWTRQYMLLDNLYAVGTDL